MKEPVFLTHFPKKIKAFYMEPNEKNPELCDSTDLLLPGVGEIVGGSVRMSDYDELYKIVREQCGIDEPNLTEEEQIAAQEMVDSFEFYLELRKYGSFFTSGFGFGLSRFLVYLGCPHIYYATLFPRTVSRLTP